MNHHQHVAVVDLGYGDAGKGTIVDWLCATQPVTAVIRFNGGAQAAHNVVTPVPRRHHTFAQFGSGTLHGVPTHLSRHMLVDPLALAAEAAHLSDIGVPDPFALLTIDRHALLTTPWHAAANRARETRRGDNRHGSCGMGIGETAAYALHHDAPRAGDTGAVLRRKLTTLRDHLTDELGPLDTPPIDDFLTAMSAFTDTVTLVPDSSTILRGRCVFEGAQGILLDEWHGFHPYTTWSTTTFTNALDLHPDLFRLGVVRTYTTRHGAGPLVTEDPSLRHPEPHNGRGGWQGHFRQGHFDAVAHRYAIEVAGGIDALAITHKDIPTTKTCIAYDTMTRIEPGPPRDLAHQEQLTKTLQNSIPVYSHEPTDIAELLHSEVLVESHGPTHLDKHMPK